MIRQLLIHRLMLASIGVALCGSCLAEIVFDGLNSYSTYRGQAQGMALTSDKPANVYILMKEVANRHIDYTAQTPENRTNMSDTYGMIIEAEGFYSYIKGSDSDARIIESQSVRQARSCFRLGRIRHASFLFHVHVKRPGFYSFALDGSYQGAPERAATVALFTSSDHGASISDAVAAWNNQYATPSWGSIEMNLGGKSPREFFTQEVYLDIGVNALYLNLGEGRHCDLDCLRVVHYEPARNETDSDTNESRSTNDLKGRAETRKNGQNQTIDAYNITVPAENTPFKKVMLLWIICMLVCVAAIILFFKRFLSI